jgi:hypothetical protein
VKSRVMTMYKQNVTPISMGTWCSWLSRSLSIVNQTVICERCWVQFPMRPIFLDPKFLDQAFGGCGAPCVWTLVSQKF